MVSKQINYSLNTDLGFNKDAIINFDLPRDTVAAHDNNLLNEHKMQFLVLKLQVQVFLSPADEGAAFTNIYMHERKIVQPQVYR